MEPSQIELLLLKQSLDPSGLCCTLRLMCLLLALWLLLWCCLNNLLLLLLKLRLLRRLLLETLAESLAAPTCASMASRRSQSDKLRQRLTRLVSCDQHNEIVVTTRSRSFAGAQVDRFVMSTRDENKKENRKRKQDNFGKAL